MIILERNGHKDLKKIPDLFGEKMITWTRDLFGDIEIWRPIETKICFQWRRGVILETAFNGAKWSCFRDSGVYGVTLKTIETWR
jgi:hypothetical protein